VSLPQGFKANAEREAQRVRNEMGLRSNAAIDLVAAANHLGYTGVSGTGSSHLSGSKSLIESSPLPSRRRPLRSTGDRSS
jgi:hypothetical protein